MTQTRAAAGVWAAVAMMAALLPALAAPEQKKPRVPAGQDPGGTAIAIIGNGLDYRDADIAARLARDGEGELIGWDVIDGDRQPFKSPDEWESVGYLHRGTAIARKIIARAPQARLVPIRIAPDDPLSIAKGLAFAVRSPARIAVIALERSSATLWAAVAAEAASARPDLLIIAAAGEDPDDPTHIKERLARPFVPTANVLAVISATADGGPLNTPDGTETTADLALTAEAFTAELLGARTFSFKPDSSIAAAEAAALAARIDARQPTADAATLKTAILALAVPYPEDALKLARSGFIAEPWRHFRPN